LAKVSGTSTFHTRISLPSAPIVAKNVRGPCGPSGYWKVRVPSPDAMIVSGTPNTPRRSSSPDTPGFSRSRPGCSIGRPCRSQATASSAADSAATTVRNIDMSLSPALSRAAAGHASQDAR
jgi:hypothetical protein